MLRNEAVGKRYRMLELIEEQTNVEEKKREVENVLVAIPCEASWTCEQEGERYVKSKQTVGQFLASMNIHYIYILWMQATWENRKNSIWKKKFSSCHRHSPNKSSCVLWWCQCDWLESVLSVTLFAPHTIFFFIFYNFSLLGVGFFVFSPRK